MRISKMRKKRQNEISKMRNFSKMRTTGFQSGDIFLQDAFSFGTEFSNSYPVFQLFFQGCRINCSTPGYTSVRSAQEWFSTEYCQAGHYL